MEAFFRALFEDVPEGLRILIWTLGDKRSRWATSWQEAARLAAQCGRTDVYVGVGLSGEDYGPKRRCSADDVRGIVGLWADIDIAGPAHKKPNLPPGQDAAETLLLSTGLAPTLTLHSGHGLQGWWLFREPWIFDTPAEHAAAKRLAARWTATLRSHARAKGWDVDGTSDLSRVLRVPGSVNTKIADDLQSVRLIELNDGLRYNPSDFDEWLIDEGTGYGAQNAAQVAITLNPDAVPPFARFEALSEAEPRFLRSWKHERRDLQDQSASAYDQSLATFAAMAGWADQEICDLLVAHRRKHGEDLKRLDYYQRTIAVARGDREQERAFEAIEELTNGEEAPIDEVVKRTALLAEISKLIGVEIRHVIKHTMDPPRYRLETGIGAIELGDVKGLIGQDQFRAKLAAAAGHYLPAFKRDRWARLAQLLLDVCEESPTGEEATDPGRGRAWLANYLAQNPVLDDVNLAGPKGSPFLKDGRIQVFSTRLRKWVIVEMLDSLAPGEMGIVLKASGCVPTKAHYQGPKKRTTADAWILPEEWLPNTPPAVDIFPPYPAYENAMR